jgi:small-conductance mechanosensitive channel
MFNLPIPAWSFIALFILTLVAFFVALKRLSRQRLLRFGQREDELFNLPVDAPTEKANSDEKKARDQIVVFHRGLRRVLGFASLLTLSLVIAIPYFPTLPAAFVSFFIGALTLVVGTAAKPAIENFIAGVVLAFSRIINIGDTVLIDGEHYGTIEDLGYTHSVIRVWDWRRYVVPNSQMLTKSFLNYSLHDSFMLAYVEFRVAPDTDLDVIERLCREIPKKSKYHAPYEDPELWIMDMEKDAIVCWCGAWADSPADAWYLKADVRSGLIRAFIKEGITTHSMRVVHEPRKEAHLTSFRPAAQRQSVSD